MVHVLIFAFETFVSCIMCQLAF